MSEKEYTSFEDRITLLRKRGMKIRGNATNELKILKENNYYNLVNGYKHLFLDKVEMGKATNIHNEEIFKFGTKPSELHSVMKFDNNMRAHFLKEILTIENKVKHAIVQAFYETFENENLHKEYEYTKDKYYKLTKEYIVQKTNKKLWQHESRFEKTLQLPIRNNYVYESDYEEIDRNDIYDTFKYSVNRAIKEQKDKKDSIKSYYNKHHYIPFWILTNILTLGNISYLFIILTDDVAYKALDKLGINHSHNELDIYNMHKILGILTLFRNICAHNERFICENHSFQIDDYFLDFGKSLPHYKDANNSSASLKHNQRERRKRSKNHLFPLIYSICIFYDNERREKFVRKIDRELNNLNKKLKSINIDAVKIDMGLDFDIFKAVSKIENNIDE